MEMGTIIICLCVALVIVLYVLNRNYYFSRNKKLISRLMKNMKFMDNELIGQERGKYLGYRYTDKNEAYRVYETKTIGNNLYYVYKQREDDKDTYDLVAEWKFNDYNFFSKIFMVEIKKGFYLEDMKEWVE